MLCFLISVQVEAAAADDKADLSFSSFQKCTRGVLVFDFDHDGCGSPCGGCFVFGDSSVLPVSCECHISGKTWRNYFKPPTSVELDARMN